MELTVCKRCGHNITDDEKAMSGHCPRCGRMHSEFPPTTIKDAGAKLACSGELEAVALAKRFHETYERLAPRLNYKTRHESAVPWHKVPDKNKMLMIAVCEELLKEGI